MSYHILANFQNSSAETFAVFDTKVKILSHIELFSAVSSEILLCSRTDISTGISQGKELECGRVLDEYVISNLLLGLPAKEYRK